MPRIFHAIAMLPTEGPDVNEDRNYRCRESSPVSAADESLLR